MTALYIHIPFCKQKCNYCDFVSYAGKEKLIDDYVAALIREFEQLLSTNYFQLSTIYFGGGTPTLLSLSHFEQLLTTFNFLLSNPEVSLEANPATADKTKLKRLRSLGINRLSIGIQSFNDQHLQVLGRIHTAKEALKFYEDARTAGFDNINLDLIFALPNQTLEEWQEDLKTALSLKPEHLSTYNLQIEPATPLHSLLTTHNLQLSSEETDLAMYQHTIKTLTAAGYKHYEISNFAKPGYECQHNLVYWRNKNYLGLGAGAHSHMNGKRWSNPNCIEAYLRNRPTIDNSIDATDQRETIFMGLRLMDGLHQDNFKGFAKEVEELTKSGLLEQAGLNIKLTRKGLYLANEVFLHFV